MKENAYKSAGVDTVAGAALVDKIKPYAKRTNRPGTMGGLGGFGACFDPKAAGFIDPVLVSATDGVGTKLKIAIETNRHDTVGIDLVAMCVNDLIVQGAEPLFFLDYFATGMLKTDTAADVIKGIATGCEMAGCALIGGETAEMPGMYGEGDYDLAGFCVGAAERKHIIDGKNVSKGDVILGLGSSGIHSNGFSLVRKIMAEKNYEYKSLFPADRRLSFADILLEPTKIYVKNILEAIKIFNHSDEPSIKALVHITGGGFYENIPRVLPENLGVKIDASCWPAPPIFPWLKDTGDLSNDDMFSTFNCGIGMMIIVDNKKAHNIIAQLNKNDPICFEIGSVNKISHNQVIIDNQDALWNLGR